MIEQAMYFGLGFLLAFLIMIFVANAVWRRAVRLTTRRVQAGLPMSLADVRADRDQLRAEFALSTRRLEIAVDELKTRSQAQIAEIGRKNEQIRVLLAEVRGRTDQLRTLEARETDLRNELLRAEAEHGDALRTHRDLEAQLAEAAKDLADRERVVDDTQGVADTRRVEIAVLQTNVARLEDQLADHGRALAAADGERTERQGRLSAVETALAEARARIVALESELAAAEAASHAQAAEVGRLQSRIVEHSGQISGHVAEAERMAGRIQDLSRERDDFHADFSRRTAEAEVRASSLLEELEGFRAQRRALEEQLAAEKAERERVSGELRRIEGAASENWDRERVENALLRERINDLAAEITTMTRTLAEDEPPVERVVAAAETGARPDAVMPAAATLGPSGALTLRPEDPRRAALAERVREHQAPWPSLRN